MDPVTLSTQRSTVVQFGDFLPPESTRVQREHGSGVVLPAHLHAPSAATLLRQVSDEYRAGALTAAERTHRKVQIMKQSQSHRDLARLVSPSLRRVGSGSVAASVPPSAGTALPDAGMAGAGAGVGAGARNLPSNTAALVSPRDGKRTMRPHKLLRRRTTGTAPLLAPPPRSLGKSDSTDSASSAQTAPGLLHGGSGGASEAAQRWKLALTLQRVASWFRDGALTPGERARLKQQLLSRASSVRVLQTRVPSKQVVSVPATRGPAVSSSSNKPLHPPVASTAQPSGGAGLLDSSDEEEAQPSAIADSSTIAASHLPGSTSSHHHHHHHPHHHPSPSPADDSADVGASPPPSSHASTALLRTPNANTASRTMDATNAAPTSQYVAAPPTRGSSFPSMGAADRQLNRAERKRARRARASYRAALWGASPREWRGAGRHRGDKRGRWSAATGATRLPPRAVGRLSATPLRVSCLVDRRRCQRLSKLLHKCVRLALVDEEHSGE